MQGFHADRYSEDQCTVDLREQLRGKIGFGSQSTIFLGHVSTFLAAMCVHGCWYGCSDSGLRPLSGCALCAAPGLRANGRETLSFPKGWQGQPTLLNLSILLPLVSSAKKGVTQGSICHPLISMPTSPASQSAEDSPC